MARIFARDERICLRQATSGESIHDRYTQTGVGCSRNVCRFLTTSVDIHTLRKEKQECKRRRPSFHGRGLTASEISHNVLQRHALKSSFPHTILIVDNLLLPSFLSFPLLKGNPPSSRRNHATPKHPLSNNLIVSCRPSSHILSPPPFTTHVQLFPRPYCVFDLLPTLPFNSLFKLSLPTQTKQRIPFVPSSSPFHSDQTPPPPSIQIANLLPSAPFIPRKVREQGATHWSSLKGGNKMVVAMTKGVDNMNGWGTRGAGISVAIGGNRKVLARGEDESEDGGDATEKCGRDGSRGEEVRGCEKRRVREGL